MNLSSYGTKKHQPVAALQGPAGLNQSGEIMQQQNEFSKFDYYRALYANIDTSQYMAYPIDWITHFSPIESLAWGEIRYRGLPFWPQFPIGQYFADFADPIKKIVIECDGKNFHSREKDAPRNAFMAGLGWRVYRISGSDCNRSLENPWEEISDKEIDRDSWEARNLIDHWFCRTIDGLVRAIAIRHYGYGTNCEFSNESARNALSLRLARG